MLRNLISQAGRLIIAHNRFPHEVNHSKTAALNQYRPLVVRNFSQNIFSAQTTVQSSTSCLLDKTPKNRITTTLHNQLTREFHAAGSKVHYLDFRHRFRTNQLDLHLLIIRRQKMKKHRKKKWRKKFKCLLAKKRLKREISKEKAFRVELLTYIRRAEQFDPKEFALMKIAEINNRPKEPSQAEKIEELKELIRKNRYQTDYIKPKHRRLSFYTTQ